MLTPPVGLVSATPLAPTLSPRTQVTPSSMEHQRAASVAVIGDPAAATLVIATWEKEMLRRGTPGVTEVAGGPAKGPTVWVGSCRYMKGSTITPKLGPV